MGRHSSTPGQSGPADESSVEDWDIAPGKFLCPICERPTDWDAVAQINRHEEDGTELCYGPARPWHYADRGAGVPWAVLALFAAIGALIGSGIVLAILGLRGVL